MLNFKTPLDNYGSDCIGKTPNNITPICEK